MSAYQLYAVEYQAGVSSLNCRLYKASSEENTSSYSCHEHEIVTSYHGARTGKDFRSGLDLPPRVFS